MRGRSGWALGVGQDLQFAMRQFRRAPGYAAFTVLVLALGIGTVTTMFTIGYAVLLKPLPFKADRGLFQPVEKSQKAGEEARPAGRDAPYPFRQPAGTAGPPRGHHNPRA